MSERGYSGLAEIPTRSGTLAGQVEGHLDVPRGASALVVFSHGSGKGRCSPRNRLMAERLNQDGFATLLVDLLTREEGEVYANKLDIVLLTDRLVDVSRWLRGNPRTSRMRFGCLGAGAGAAAALRAAARLEGELEAVVCRGGRLDLAMDALPWLRAPTLLIVGGRDVQVLELNRRAYDRLGVEKGLEIVPGCGHLFEETGALQQAAGLAAEWFARHLVRQEAGALAI